LIAAAVQMLLKTSLTTRLRPLGVQMLLKTSLTTRLRPLSVQMLLKTSLTTRLRPLGVADRADIAAVYTFQTVSCLDVAFLTLPNEQEANGRTQKYPAQLEPG